MELQDLLEKIKEYNPDSDLALIQKAYDYADKAHKGQKRNSGEPYIIHPLHAAMILADLHMDDATICAGLLHDVLEDTPFTKDQMEEDFGEEITNIVDGVTKLKAIESKSKLDNQVDNYRKMVMAMANDIRVIIVKLADRLHNLRTLDYKGPEKQVEKATETLEIYVPIAGRLGIYSIKSELEDLCLKYLKPDAFHEIAERVDKKLSERKEYIQRIIGDLKKELEKYGINCEITGRPKTLYSIYKKMYKQHKTFDQIFDITAIRVLVDDYKDCYSVLGIVHTMWKPIPKRFKDYIAMPKPNMYQSLHTTVIGPEGETFEVQIRTWEMHQVAEYGIAAHWRYKEGKSQASDTKFDKKLTWVRQLMEWQKTTTDTHDFLDTLKGEFFTDEVYVFSPAGDVIELPKDASPVDFAYHIHSQIGDKCVGAKVDGRLVPLDYKLKNGNIVEIITSKNSIGPSKDWLGFVKSSTAKNKIRNFFKHANRDENIESGKEMVIQSLKQDGYNPNKLMTEEAYERLIKRMSFSNVDDLFAAVGYGSQSVASVTSKLKEYYKTDMKKVKARQVQQTGHFGQKPKNKQVSKNTVRIKGEGVSNLAVKFAQCCHPLPGDEIIGYVTKGRGISIHRTDCPNVVNTPNKERLIQVEWDNPENDTFFADLELIGLDHPGFLANIAETMKKLDINLSRINASHNGDATSTMFLTVEIESKAQLEDLITKLENLEDTISIYRTNV